VPSSGARSGTHPSRTARGAGDGTPAWRAVSLACGHETSGEPLAQVGAKRIYVCPEGCGISRGRGISSSP
jgi:hypothetical protein